VIWLSQYEPHLLEAKAATVERMTMETGLHGAIHFACHDIGNPLPSEFLLHNSVFELTEIMKQKIPHLKFTFRLRVGRVNLKSTRASMHGQSSDAPFHRGEV